MKNNMPHRQIEYIQSITIYNWLRFKFKIAIWFFSKKIIEIGKKLNKRFGLKIGPNYMDGRLMNPWQLKWFNDYIEMDEFEWP